jgi:hypothetical protein
MNINDEVKTAFHKYIDSTMDKQELLKNRIEKLIQQSYPNAVYNHFEIESSIRIQHDDRVGYCATISLVVCYFSYLINKCNPKFCQEVSNKKYIESIITILKEFSYNNIKKFKYNTKNSMFCKEGGFLCQFNIFFFCFLLFNNIITEKDINNYFGNLHVVDPNYREDAYKLCDEVINDFNLRKYVLGYSDMMTEIVHKY